MSTPADVHNKSLCSWLESIPHQVILCVDRERCEELRTIQSRRTEQQVCSERAAQVRSRQEQEEQRQREEKVFDELWEADRRAKEKREEQRVQRQQQRDMQQLDVIRRQMEEAEQQRQQQRQLRDDEAELMVCTHTYTYSIYTVHTVNTDML